MRGLTDTERFVLTLCVRHEPHELQGEELRAADALVFRGLCVKRMIEQGTRWRLLPTVMAPIALRADAAVKGSVGYCSAWGNVLLGKTERVYNEPEDSRHHQQVRI